LILFGCESHVDIVVVLKTLDRRYNLSQIAEGPLKRIIDCSVIVDQIVVPFPEIQLKIKADLGERHKIIAELKRQAFIHVKLTPQLIKPWDALIQGIKKRGPPKLL
jgi:hypothetical protein